MLQVNVPASIPAGPSEVYVAGANGKSNVVSVAIE
jgi:hypothetical protein